MEISTAPGSQGQGFGWLDQVVVDKVVKSLYNTDIDQQEAVCQK